MSRLTSRIGSLSLLSLVLTTLMITPASAQFIDTPACVQQTYDRLAYEKRLYRSVLFGQQDSADLPIDSVRYDTDGNVWMKTSDNNWTSTTQGDNGPISDVIMDDRADIQKRRGIFEVRKTPTSDLIPLVTQALRAYQCHLLSVCAAAQASQDPSSAQKQQLTVQPDGCISMTQPVLTSCKEGVQGAVSASSCTDVVQAMLQEEQQELMLLIAYDSAVRSLYQFAGVFDGFLEEVRFPLIEPLWQTVRALGSINNIPCFVGQCDQ